MFKENPFRFRLKVLALILAIVIVFAGIFILRDVFYEKKGRPRHSLLF